VAFLRALVAVWRLRPRLVMLGSVERLVPWFVRARRAGLLGGARLAVTNQLHLTAGQLEQVDRTIVYSQAWIDGQPRAVQERAVFLPLPADGELDPSAAERDAGYVFAGGGTGRDFASLIEALRDTDVPLRIVTFTPRTLGWSGPLPSNVEVEWQLPLPAFLKRMASARAVVVPLRDPLSDFGQTTLVQALALGKPLVATRAPGTVDYVHHGRQGLLVEAGDVAGYRDAVLRLYVDEALRRTCRRYALEQARRSSYAAFAEGVTELCRTLTRG
jgi:glycosyltransferase involved in cell wall biosynthesis